MLWVFAQKLDSSSETRVLSFFSDNVLLGGLDENSSEGDAVIFEIISVEKTRIALAKENEITSKIKRKFFRQNLKRIFKTPMRAFLKRTTGSMFYKLHEKLKPNNQGRQDFRVGEFLMK
jgi:hypothetical protein